MRVLQGGRRREDGNCPARENRPRFERKSSKQTTFCSLEQEGSMSRARTLKGALGKGVYVYGYFNTRSPPGSRGVPVTVLSYPGHACVNVNPAIFGDTSRYVEGA